MTQQKLPQFFTEAFHWLCKSRSNYPPASDIWDFRRSWDKKSDALVKNFSSGTYIFDVQKKIILSFGETITFGHQWMSL